MTWLQQLHDWLAKLKCWYTVRPWERAIRVRLGKSIAAIQPGIHLRLPFLDEVFTQNVRQRVLNLPVQTVTNKGGETVTLSGVVRWRIADLRKTYEKLHTPEDWILNTVLAAIAETVYESNGQLSPDQVGKVSTDRLLKDGAAEMGMEIESVSVTDLSRVRTYRLITGEGNSGWSWSRLGALDVVARS